MIPLFPPWVPAWKAEQLLQDPSFKFPFYTNTFCMEMYSLVTTKCPTTGASYYIADARPKLKVGFSVARQITRRVFYKGPLSKEWSQLGNAVALFASQAKYFT